MTESVLSEVERAETERSEADIKQRSCGRAKA